MHQTRFDRHHDVLRFWTTQLYHEFDDICYKYRLRLRKPLIRIVELRSVWGQWDPETRAITIARQLIENHSWDHVVEILKHEMAHMIVHEIMDLADHNHGDAFQSACRRIGTVHWACRSSAEAADFPPGHSTEGDEDQKKVMRLAQKLLALAESSNEHEAVLAMKKVQDLYSKYNIERLSKNTSQPLYYEIINRKKKKISQMQSRISSILVSHFFVEVIFSDLYDAQLNERHKTLEIIGSEANVKMAIHVYHFLYEAIDRLWRNYKKMHPQANSKRSYCLGILHGFRTKLNQEATYTSQEGHHWHLNNITSQTTALVHSMDQELADMVNYRFPRLSTRRSSTSYVNRELYDQGSAEGQRLVIHKPIHRTGQDSPRLLN